MAAVLTLLFGFFSGYFFNILTMKVSFKQRTVDNKIKIYDSLIFKWLEIRNHIIHFDNQNSNKLLELDKLYGQSLAYIGEAFLVSDDQKLIEDIDNFNERYNRTKWAELSDIADPLTGFKKEGVEIIRRMKDDIHENTRFVWSDLSHLFKGFFKS